MDIYSTDIKTLDLEGSYAILSMEEKNRVGAFGHEPARLRFIHTRAFVRRMLAEKLGQSPESLIFESSEHGKPYVKGNPCYFNISHSGDLIALAISDKEVGLDLEYMQKERNLMALAEYSMQSKLALIREAAEPRMEFYRWWTVFEAGIKLAGLSVVTNRDTYPEHFYTVAKNGYMLSVATESPAEVKFEGVIVPPFERIF